MIGAEGIEKVVPDAGGVEEAVEAYYRFYAQEQEAEFGVVALKIKRS